MAAIEECPDWVATEVFRSASDEDDDNEVAAPPLMSRLSRCFRNRTGPSVGVARPELGGL